MKSLWAVPILGLAFASLTSVAANAATFTFTGSLSGMQEVPPKDTPAIGSYQATLDGDPDNWTFSYEVKFSDLSGPLTLAHIHEAPRGVNGPVVHDLDNPPLGKTEGTIFGNWLSTEAKNPAETFEELLAGNYYFNLHSSVIPSGELRGQIERDSESSTSVPEPTSAIALTLVGGVSLLVRRRQQVAN